VQDSNGSSEEYEEYLRLMGHQVVKTSSFLWINTRPRYFQPSPPFILEGEYGVEAAEVLIKTKAFACRWFSRAESPVSTMDRNGAVKLYVVEPPYELAQLHPKARNQTRRGLERFEVQKVKLDEGIEENALSVYRDNVLRLQLMKTDAQIIEKWGRWMQAIRDSKCTEFWCAKYEGKICAFTVVVQTPWGKEIVLQRSHSGSLKLYPNNALVYTVVKESFNQGASLVSFGLSAFAGGRNSLDHFKCNMGFGATPLQEHFLWHPAIRPFSSLLNSTRLRKLHRLFSGS
jgi:hypothetical protein